METNIDDKIIDLSASVLSKIEGQESRYLAIRHALLAASSVFYLSPETSGKLLSALIEAEIERGH